MQYDNAGVSREHHAQADVDAMGNLVTRLYVPLGLERSLAPANLRGHAPTEEIVLEFLVSTKSSRTSVIQRSDDLLTRDDLRRHEAEVESATLEELMTWVKYNSFRRRSLEGATNVMDSRYVAKWKWIKRPTGQGCQDH